MLGVKRTGSLFQEESDVTVESLEVAEADNESISEAR